MKENKKIEGNEASETNENKERICVDCDVDISNRHPAYIRCERCEVENPKGLDREIRELVEFMNSLDGITTIGSCCGHNDGGNTGNFTDAYITFRCKNDRMLGLLASLSFAYEDTEDCREEYKKIQPKLEAYWRISVLDCDDSEFSPEELDEKPTDWYYVSYSLSPDINSYEKPTDIYCDFKEILEYYKIKYRLVNGEDLDSILEGVD